jgi:iodotyrosine deiodinase
VIPLQFERLSAEQMLAHADAFLETMQVRRTVRQFSADPVDLDVIRRCIAAAGTAPSGAHKQPWTFVLVTDPSVKKQIREAAEEEERAFYGGRAGAEWLSDLMPFETNADKPFLETAPALIVIFAQTKPPDGGKNYYVPESVGIAVGLLIAALHHAGLASLTHTPAPMKFLAQILGRPKGERPFLLMPVGYPADGCEVPDLDRKALSEILIER